MSRPKSTYGQNLADQIAATVTTTDRPVNVVVLAAEQPFFTRREAAEFLRISVATLDTIRTRGEIPDFTPLGLGPKSVTFRRRDLEAYMARSFADSNPEHPTELRAAS